MAIYRQNIANTRRTALVVLCGRKGERGSDGVMATPEVISIINNHIHTIPHEDGLTYTPDGRLRVTIEELTELP